MSGVDTFQFHEKRESGASLREIKAIQRTAKAERKKHISDTIIESLNSERGLVIVAGDTLAHISSLTAKGNRLSFNNEADHIDIGDKITIRQEGEKRYLYKNDTKVGKVLEGYRASTTQAVASLRDDIETGVSTPVRNQLRTTRNKLTHALPSINESGNENHDGAMLANYIAGRGYPIWENGAYCGKNVGELLLEFGIDDLPRSGRHGKLWDQFCENSNYFTKVAISNPADAKAGGVLVYNEGFGPRYKNGREVPRYKYGHVEIALGNGKTYFGNVASRPGGSINASSNPNRSGFTGYVYYPTGLSNHIMTA